MRQNQKFKAFNLESQRYDRHDPQKLTLADTNGYHAIDNAGNERYFRY